VPGLPLPLVDEHVAEIPADPDAVWLSLCGALDRSFSGTVSTRYSRLVGVADRAASGPRPLEAGSTVPGFHVVTAIAGRELALEGRHRFSIYRLAFRLSPTGPARTRLHAETRAAFPGPAGALYRLLVITSGAHAAGMRRLLAAVRRGAVRAAADG
jgi:hypothetical protein